MLFWALIFLVSGVIATILGFGGIAGAAFGIAQILFFGFLVIFIAALLMYRRGRRYRVRSSSSRS